MVRAIIWAGLLAAVIAVLLIAPDAVQRFRSGDLPHCDLLAGPCHWETESGRWLVALEAGEPDSQGTKYQLLLTAPEPAGRLIAVLSGENMYMGKYPIPLEQENEHHYKASFVAPFCTTADSMVWRIDFQNGQADIGNVPWALVFNAKK